MNSLSTGSQAGDGISALSAHPRPSRPSAFSVSLTFAWRSMLKIKHVPEQLGDVVVIPIIFTVLFTYLFGGALSGATSAYLQFLLPGTLVMTILLLTMYTGVGLSTDISTGVSDRFRSLAIWRPGPIVGALLGDVVRYLAATALVIGLGAAMGYRAPGGVIGVVAGLGLLLAFAFAISWIWTLVALIVRTPSTLMVGGLVLLFPLTMASNVFVEPGTMPWWLQDIVKANPVSHLVTAVRGLMGGTATAGQIGWVLVTSIVLVAIFAPLTMLLYRKGR
jgi:ABC-2 type transport system permease protein